MAHEAKKGIDCKVTLGANKIIGLGTWEITGGAVEQITVDEFGSTYQDVELGLFTGGTFSFSGLYKKDQTTGQDLIRHAFHLQSNLTSLQFYVDSVSYYMANTTTAAGGGLPAGVTSSKIYITADPTIGADKGGLVSISFSGIYTTGMRLN